MWLGPDHRKIREVRAHILLTKALGLNFLAWLGFLQLQVRDISQSTKERCLGLSEEAKGSFPPGTGG